MKWKGRRQSDNVEDRRGMSGGGKVVAGGGAIAIVFFLVKMFFPEAAPFVDTIQQTRPVSQSPAALRCGGRRHAAQTRRAGRTGRILSARLVARACWR